MHNTTSLCIDRDGVDVPCTDLSELHAGDECLLTGVVYTARDATCRRLAAALEKTAHLPFGLEGQTLFFAGPTPGRAGQVVGSIGPTTARRMDEATVAMMDAGIVATIGKGSRSRDVAEACRRNRGVYFGAVGGIAALLARHVRTQEVIAYPELGTEALIRLEIDRFPVFVALDSQGTDWYEEAPKRFLASLEDR